MRVRVKICGLTTTAAVDAAVEAGADAVGFVLSPSPRCVGIDRARLLAERLPPFVAAVAVFRHPADDDVRAAVAALRPHLVQAEPRADLETACHPAALLAVLHDGPAIEKCATTPATAFLLEAPGRGGRGIAPDWGRAERLARRVRLVLAGGLTPENVGEAIRRVRPYAVDVSSGVETAPGVKDPRLIRTFLAAVRAAASAMEED